MALYDTDEEVAAEDVPPPPQYLAAEGRAFPGAPAPRQPWRPQIAPTPPSPAQRSGYFPERPVVIPNPEPDWNERLQQHEVDLARWASSAADSRMMNARLAASRDAVKAATEFVRRKDVERMVRDGTPLEEAIFRSYQNFGTPQQSNAARPVPAPAAMTIGGTPGVVYGARGEQWKPIKVAQDIIRDVGGKLVKVKPDGTMQIMLDSKEGQLSPVDKAQLGMLVHERNTLASKINDPVNVIAQERKNSAVQQIMSLDGRIENFRKAARPETPAGPPTAPAAPPVSDRKANTIYMTPKGPHRWTGQGWTTP